jgi:hypothetical protein
VRFSGLEKALSSKAFSLYEAAISKATGKTENPL